MFAQADTTKRSDTKQQKNKKRPDDETIKKKIVFVNSFKGGTGKTTFSFANCIDALFNAKKKKEVEYENVIYLDLDILGTATSYLFDEDQLPNKDSFNKTGEPQKIVLKLNRRQQGTLHVGYISPEMKNNSLYGEPYFLNHRKLAEELFIGKVEDYIEKQMSKKVSSLIVIDCAPGFGETEQRMLEYCYRKFSQAEVELQEMYLVTLDSAHVEKCIQCLKDNKKIVSQGERSIRLVVNDVQNYCDYLTRQGDDCLAELDEIMQTIYQNSSDLNMTFYLWKYSEGIALNSIHTRKKSLENHVGDYLLTNANYLEWRKGNGFV